MLNVVLTTAQRCFFDPNPQDSTNSPTTPGVGPEYLISDAAVLSVDASGARPDIVPAKAGAAIITIRGAAAAGQPYIISQVSVTVNPGPLDHWAPTADAPRTA